MRMLRKESLAWKIYPNPGSNNGHASTRSGLARVVATRRIVTKLRRVPCMIWATLQVRWICRLLSRSIVVPSAKNISIPTWALWLKRGVTIPVAWLNGRFDWWPRMDWLIGLRHGISGETIVFSFLGLQSKTGLRRRGKKFEDYVSSTYIDQVMADFSGYIAMDELYDSPFFIFSIVDNHTYRRLFSDVR